MRPTSSLIWFALFVALGGAAVAGESKSARAKVLYEEGMKNYNLGHFAEAAKSFEAAYFAKADPVFLFNIGQCHRMLGNWNEEIYSYHRYLAERSDAPNRAEVEQFIATAEGQIKRQVAGAPPTSTLAPSSTPEPKEPASAPEPVATPAPRSAAATVSAAPGDAAPSVSTPIYRRWWLWTIVAVAVVGIGVGLGFGLAPHDGTVPRTTAGTMMVTF